MLDLLMPTWDRVSELKITLGVLLDKIDEDCTIIISDNCSNDSTRLFLSKLNNKRVQIYLQEKHITYDEQLLFLLTKSTAEYCFFCSDKYDYSNLDFSRIQESIRKNPNYIGFKDLFVEKRKMWSLPYRIIALPEGTYYLKDLEKKSILPRYTIISSIIFRKKRIDHSKLKRFIKSNFIQIPIFLECYCDGRIIVLNQEIRRFRQDWDGVKRWDDTQGLLGLIHINREYEYKLGEMKSLILNTLLRDDQLVRHFKSWIPLLFVVKVFIRMKNKLKAG